MKPEWETEPNRVEFKHAGFDCLINRSAIGSWCGYVAVKPDHPWFEKNCGDVPADVHGGLTYAHHCRGEICHETDEKDNVWWVGFDCAHIGDLVPHLNKTIENLFAVSCSDKSLEFHLDDGLINVALTNLGSYSGTYKNQAYVTQETKSLAEQALEAMKLKQ